jgi:hypothetical protein
MLQSLSHCSHVVHNELVWCVGKCALVFKPSNFDELRLHIHVLLHATAVSGW